MIVLAGLIIVANLVYIAWRLEDHDEKIEALQDGGGCYVDMTHKNKHNEGISN